MFLEQSAVVLLGLVFGSLLNVIIYRLPRDKSIIYPGSACPLCAKKIPLHRNIPLVSYLLQMGKCAECKGAISIKYPIVECLSVLLWMESFQNFSGLDIFFSVWISSSILSIILIDLDKFIIPFKLILAGFIAISAQYFLSDNFVLTDTIWGLIIGVGYLGFIFALTSFYTRKQTLGYGDLLLIALIGAWLGSPQVLAVIFLAAAASLTCWITISLITGNFDRNRRLPFGSFLGAVALIYHYFQPDLFINFGLEYF